LKQKDAPMKKQNAARRCLVLVSVAGAMWLLLGCHRDSAPNPNEGAPANWEQSLKDAVVGDWEEIHGTKEILQFSSDGTLVMDSPREHNKCKYDFPDYQHVRLDCAMPGTPSRPISWKVSISDDTLKISDTASIGTYKRK
jgi:hypothetical protein